MSFKFFLKPKFNQMLFVGSFPGFGGIFTITQPQNRYPDGHQTYYKDERNMLELIFEWLEMSGI